MAHRSLLTEAVDRYLGTVVVHETPVQKRLREETSKLPEAGMQIGADQGVFLAFLARLVGARRAIEVGTFTGYSALSVASALAPDGRLVCCDVSEKWTSIARRYWAEAGIADRIELRLAPARETLAELKKRDGRGSYDFAFIDADKTAYREYYERCLQLLRTGGLVAVDNTLWSGRVADPKVKDADTEALRAFNSSVTGDERVDLCLVPIGDGLTLLRKR